MHREDVSMRYTDELGMVWLVEEWNGDVLLVPIGHPGWPHSDDEFLRAMRIERYEEINETE
jgi:hypothetical protein